MNREITEDPARDGDDCATFRYRLRDGTPDYWTPNAKSDMAALAKHPAVRAIDIDPDSRGSSDGDIHREVAAERSKSTAILAARRLAEMRRTGHPEATRLARVVWYVYGERGETLARGTAKGEATESTFEAVTRRFATADEVTAHAKTLKSMRPEQRKAVAPMSLGAMLVEMATDAYERDQWPAQPVVPAPAEPTLAERMAAAIAKTRRGNQTSETG